MGTKVVDLFEIVKMQQDARSFSHGEKVVRAAERMRGLGRGQDVQDVRLLRDGDRESDQSQDCSLTDGIRRLDITSPR